MADEDIKKPETEAAPAPVEEKAPVAAEKPAEEKPAAKETPTPAPAPEGSEKPVEKPEEKPAGAPAPEGGGNAPGEGEKKPDKKRDIFAEIAGGEPEEIKIHKAKGSKHVSRGIVHITATFNNTMVTVSDTRGNVIGWSTAGKMGFKGSRKSTAYAAQVVSQDACRQAMGHGLKEADVRVKGPGSGREAAVRAVQGIGIDILSITDVTPIPHNGCRPKKARRV